uniref:Ig-like domain-containing protein n=1 Tax=Takifugu rubripes TaxID=31033 RepID=A0A674MKM7_TAKRU
MVEAFTTVLHVTGTSVGVSQKPSFTILRTGESVVSEINCSHSISSYDRIYWYKQDESRALKLLGYLYTNIQNVEEDVKGKISFDGDGRSGSSLSIAAVGLKDSGVYFCTKRSSQPELHTHDPELLHDSLVPAPSRRHWPKADRVRGSLCCEWRWRESSSSPHPGTP